jgi:sulfide:quinone oxidoreductase
MPDRVLILGAGTGGTLVANRLQKSLGSTAEIVVVDKDDCHVYQPGLLFVPFGLGDPQALVRSRRAQLRNQIDFRIADVDRVETEANVVRTTDGRAIPYDVLVIASGATLLPEETEGLTGAGWRETSFDFYTLEGACELRDVLARFDQGRLVVNLVDLPIKCPVAPLEFCFLADWYLRRRGVRRNVELVYVTPLDGAFTKPVASELLADLLSAKAVSMETEFAVGRVDGGAGKLISWDEREVAYDLLVTIPLHGGAPFVERSPGLGDELGFVRVDPATLQARAAANVFAIGDATNAPTSKAGSVTHFEGDTLVENVQRLLAGSELVASFDGHANCFVETGSGKAMLIDFNYDVEPLPGRFPVPVLGPLPLLKQSRLNHLAKLAFEWIYWHALLPGRALPGVSTQLSLAGKDVAPLAHEPTANRPKEQRHDQFTYTS